MTAKQRGEGFQKPRTSTVRREVRLAVVNYPMASTATCSCGWAYFHKREKVREDAIDKHLIEKHGGAGIRI